MLVVLEQAGLKTLPITTIPPAMQGHREGWEHSANIQFIQDNNTQQVWFELTCVLETSMAYVQGFLSMRKKALKVENLQTTNLW